MDLTRSGVNPRRNYDASRRRRRAEEGRARILEVARRLFLENGYGATAVSQIADEADVSVETIYKAFGGKAGLVRSLVERALEGTGASPAERRSDDMRAHETDARKVIENWGAFVGEVAPLVAPILILARGASASDPELVRVLDRADAARLARMELNAGALLGRGDLRPGITLAEARDVLWTYSSAELYELLVVHRGWPIERYCSFVARGMTAALLPAEAGGR
jgi:AcrR family transcriptional regulator